MQLEDVTKNHYNLLGDMVVITTADTLKAPGPEIVFVNDAFCSHSGYAPEEVLGRSPRLLLGPATDPAVTKKMSQRLAKWQPVREIVLNYRKDGTPFWVDLCIVPVADDTGWYHYWISVQRDVTDQVVTKERLELTTAASGDGIWDWNIQSGDLTASDRLKEIVGTKGDIDSTIDAFYGRLLPYDRPRVEAAILKHLKTRERFDITYRLRHEDGHYIHVRARGQAAWDADGAPIRMVGTVSDISDHVIANAELTQAQDLLKVGHWSWTPESESFKGSQQVWRILGETPDPDRPWDQFVEALGPDARDRLTQFIATDPDENAFLQFRRDGQDGVQHLRLRVHVNDLSKGASYVFGTIEDCTSEVLQNEALNASERLAASGQIASGVAHDFNNLLTAISVGADCLTDDTSAAQREEILKDIQIAVSQGHDLTESLLNYTTQAPLAPQSLNIQESLQAIIGLASRTMPENTLLKLDCEDDLPEVVLDRSGFETSILNLMLNARDAGGPACRIRIAAERRKDSLWISVDDDGPGIPPELRAKVVEPFFSTKPKGEGTGIGLSREQGFTRQSGGDLQIDTSPWGGARLVLTFPLSRS